MSQWCTKVMHVILIVGWSTYSGPFGVVTVLQVNHADPKTMLLGNGARSLNTGLEGIQLRIERDESDKRGESTERAYHRIR